MRGVGHEAPLRIQRLLELAIARLELGQHVVEGDGQLADLVRRPVVLDAAAEVALGADGLRGLRDAVDGAQRGAGQHPAEGKRGQDRQAAADEQDQPQGVERLLRLRDREGHLHDAG